MTTITLAPNSPVTHVLEAVMKLIPATNVSARGAVKKTFPAVFKSLFQNTTHDAEQIAFLDEQALSALNYIKSLSFIKLLQHIEADIAYPTWRTDSKSKNNCSAVNKLIKLLTTKDLSTHTLVARRCLSTVYLSQNHDCARYAFSLMFDFALIRLYRQKIFQDGMDYPIAVNAVREHYLQRLGQLDLNEKAWCDESAALDKENQLRAYRDFTKLLAKLESALCAQAKADSDLLINYMQKPVGLVKRLAIETHIFNCYRELFISSGLTAPRFNWQLKSLLSMSAAEKIFKDFV